MSKISEYIKAYEDHYGKENQPISVKAFAEDLNRPVETMIAQFAAAGISVGPDDLVSEADKETLLNHLRSQHKGQTPNKVLEAFLNLETESQRHLRAVAQDENGAEWDTLQSFAESIVFDVEIDPLMQRLVNLIIARSFITGALPSMRRGRPKGEDTDRIGEEIARSYWEMRDGGMGYAEATEKLCSKHHKEQRQIMRIVKEYTNTIGKTQQEREQKRRWENLLREIYSDSAGKDDSLRAYRSVIQARELPPELADFQFDGNDCLERIQELIGEEAAKLPPLTKKSLHLKPVTGED